MSLLIQFKNERLTEISQNFSDATFYDRINSVYRFIETFLDRESRFF